jgi:protein ImuA
MGCMSPLQDVSRLDRAACLSGKNIEPLRVVQQRFSRTVSVSKEIDAGLPCRGLPLGCIHEVQNPGLASGIAFASLLAGRIPPVGGQLIYIASDRSFHPLGLLPQGVQPERWIHVTARSLQDLAWTVLETLRCPQVSAVLAVVKAADLTLCRRFQLAAESSGSTGFLLTDTTAKPAIASVITRWQISSIPAPPGATFGEACWDINLIYCRGGRPGRWNTVWRNGQLESLELSSQTVASQPARRVGCLPANRLAG